MPMCPLSSWQTSECLPTSSQNQMFMLIKQTFLLPWGEADSDSSRRTFVSLDFYQIIKMSGVFPPDPGVVRQMPSLLGQRQEAKRACVQAAQVNNFSALEIKISNSHMHKKKNSFDIL